MEQLIAVPLIRVPVCFGSICFSINKLIRQVLLCILGAFQSMFRSHSLWVHCSAPKLKCTFAFNVKVADGANAQVLPQAHEHVRLWCFFCTSQGRTIEFEALWQKHIKRCQVWRTASLSIVIKWLRWSWEAKWEMGSCRLYHPMLRCAAVFLNVLYQTADMKKISSTEVDRDKKQIGEH